jgi:proline iminopeptidase
MVTWSLETLNLAFYVIAILCALYIAFKALQYKNAGWGFVFLLIPIVFWAASRWVGPLIAGILILGPPLYYIRQPYVWKTLGRIYVYVILCWAGSTALAVRANGWIPESLFRRSATIEQAGTATEAAAGTESYLPVEGGRIWYKKSGNGKGIPVILVHGGPGATSHYLKPLEALGDERPVVRYDQLGAGHSDKVTDTTLFTIAHFVKELDSLRAALGFDKVHIVGHSWGSILGFEYYRAHPEHVASLTLAGAALSIPEWQRNTRKLVLTLSDSSQQAIKASEAANDFDSPDYVKAMDEFYGKYVWRRPVEEDRDSMMKSMSQPIASYMQGPSEFTITGTLKTYDATRLLPRVKVPTLYTVGEYDEANPATIRRFAARTPGAKVEVIPDAAHITTWDNTEAMLRVVREFLRTVDSTTAIP